MAVIKVVRAEPYYMDVARGNVLYQNYFRVLGYNGDVDNIEEDLWSVGGIYTFPPSAMQMEVVSTSPNDDGSPEGTGARTVKIHYLDGDYAEQTETITIILRINEFHIETVGSNGAAVGDIDIRHLDDTPVYARIPALAIANTALQAIWTVPAGKIAYIVEWQVGIAGVAGNKAGRFVLRSTSTLDGVLTTGVFQYKDIIVIQDGCVNISLPIPIKVPAQADIKISVVGDAVDANAICAGHFAGWYGS